MPGPPSSSDFTTYSTMTGPAQLRGNGVILAVSQVKISRITDGTSQVLLIGEKHIPVGQYDTASVAGNDQGWDLGFDLDINRWTKYPPLGDSEPFPPHFSGDDAWSVFGSAHTAGCQFVLCDGSVHTITYDIDPDTFRRLGSIADGEIIAEDAF